MARVWPDRIVEENNLQWQISALRGGFRCGSQSDRYRVRRGYTVYGEIDTVSGSPARRCRHGNSDRAARAAADEPCQSRFRADRRDDLLGEILNLAAVHRLVTLTGAGGIGKTGSRSPRRIRSLRADLRRRLAGRVFANRRSRTSCPSRVCARAIGSSLGGGVSRRQRVAQALAGRRLVLVLGHLRARESALQAALAEAVLRAAGRCALSPPAASRCGRRASGSSGTGARRPGSEICEDADELLR